MLDYFTKALNIKIKALGADHRNVASIYNNMAALYQKTEKFADALEHYRLALSIEKKELAAGGRSDDPINEEDEESEGDSPTQKLLHHRVTHDDVAQTHVHLAMIHFSMNNESEAMHAYQAAADTYLMAPKETAMEGDPSLNAELATVYFQMADLLQAKDDSEGALEFLEKSLKIQQKVLGSYHLDVAHTYNMIADVHFSNGDVEPCIANFQSAREIYELTGEAESADMAHLLSNLALAHEEVEGRAAVHRREAAPQQVAPPVRGEDVALELGRRLDEQAPPAARHLATAQIEHDHTQSDGVRACTAGEQPSATRRRGVHV